MLGLAKNPIIKEIPRHLKFIFINYLLWSGSECDPYTEKACIDAANVLGLLPGRKAHPFAGDWWIKGCYASSGGPYTGYVYYGTGGTIDQMKTVLVGNFYRPMGYDCTISGIRNGNIGRV